MESPPAWGKYHCEDYFQSSLAETGWWDDPSQCWYIEPVLRVYEDPKRAFLVIGRPGVDGIEWGYRKGRRGIWAHYPVGGEFRWLAESARALKEGYATGTLTV